MKPYRLLEHKPPRFGCGEGKDAGGILSGLSAEGQLEAVKIGLPPASLISLAHIFLIAATTGAGIGT